MAQWTRFDEGRPDGGDTIIVFDPACDELTVFIYGETGQQEGYLSEAWQFSDTEWEPDPEWLWMPCPMPPTGDTDPFPPLAAEPNQDTPVDRARDAALRNLQK